MQAILNTRTWGRDDIPGHKYVRCVLGGDFNMVKEDVDHNLRTEFDLDRYGPGWTLAPSDPRGSNGDKDFLFATCTDVGDEVTSFRRATEEQDGFFPLWNKEKVHWLVGAKLEIRGPVHASSPVPPRPQRPPPIPSPEPVATSPLPAPSTPKHVEQVEVQGSELAAAQEPPPEVAPDDVASAPSRSATEVVDVSARAQGTESVTVEGNDEPRRIREAKFDSAKRSTKNMFSAYRRRMKRRDAEFDESCQARTNQYNENFCAAKKALLAAWASGSHDELIDMVAFAAASTANIEHEGTDRAVSLALSVSCTEICKRLVENDYWEAVMADDRHFNAESNIEDYDDAVKFVQGIQSSALATSQGKGGGHRQHNDDDDDENQQVVPSPDQDQRDQDHDDCNEEAPRLEQFRIDDWTGEIGPNDDFWQDLFCRILGWRDVAFSWYGIKGCIGVTTEMETQWKQGKAPGLPGVVLTKDQQSWVQKMHREYWTNETEKGQEKSKHAQWEYHTKTQRAKYMRSCYRTSCKKDCGGLEWLSFLIAVGTWDDAVDESFVQANGGSRLGLRLLQDQFVVCWAVCWLLAGQVWRV